MKDLTKLPAQQSVGDYTPYELSQIDTYQDTNRGVDDEGEEWLENFNEED